MGAGKRTVVYIDEEQPEVAFVVHASVIDRIDELELQPLERMWNGPGRFWVFPDVLDDELRFAGLAPVTLIVLGRACMLQAVQRSWLLVSAAQQGDQIVAIRVMLALEEEEEADEES